MPLWKIEPAADSRDPRWLDHVIWEEVIVRAPTAATARVVAGGLERSSMSGIAPTGNESPSFRSGFEDEKLYRVTKVHPDSLAGVSPTGQHEVVRQKKRDG